MAYTHSYTYLGVTFTRPRFSSWKVACAPLSHGYVILDTLERNCAHLQFQDPWTKLWLFGTLVTPTLLYGVETWGDWVYITTSKNLSRLAWNESLCNDTITTPTNISCGAPLALVCNLNDNRCGPHINIDWRSRMYLTIDLGFQNLPWVWGTSSR